MILWLILTLADPAPQDPLITILTGLISAGIIGWVTAHGVRLTNIEDRIKKLEERKQ